LFKSNFQIQFVQDLSGSAYLNVAGKSVQNVNPKFKPGSHLYLGAPLSISANDAGKLVLTGQYLIA
jgi:hypothetical protein